MFKRYGIGAVAAALAISGCAPTVEKMRESGPVLDQRSTKTAVAISACLQDAAMKLRLRPVQTIRPDGASVTVAATSGDLIGQSDISDADGQRQAKIFVGKLHTGPSAAWVAESKSCL